MPLFDYLCLDCGKSNELIVIKSSDEIQCDSCGSRNLDKLVSAPSSLSGAAKNRMPSLEDTSCCGSAPNEAGCAGPGSCCGKSPI